MSENRGGDLIKELRARIAELEAGVIRLTDENHSWRRCSKTWKPGNIALRERAEAAEACLAAVIALCDDLPRRSAWAYISADAFEAEVRAAATGAAK